MKPDCFTRDSGPAPGTTISDLRRGATARVTRVAAGAALSQRMRVVGIRPGVDVHVLQGPDRRGAVLRVGGARIALGSTVLDAVLVAPVDPAEGTSASAA